MVERNEFVCCICGKKFIGWGNNPWPINDDPDARCCNGCNTYQVVPARLRQLEVFEASKQITVDEAIDLAEDNGK